MNHRKGFLNFIFALFAGTGIFLIIRIDALAGEYRFLYPSVLIGIHALWVGVLTRKMEDEAFAEHHLDSVYFLGFLFTLVSLAVMFTRFQQTGFEDGSAFTGALFYIGISVTTSIGGVLLRNILRGAYLKGRPREGAGDWEGDEGGTLAMIRVYLEERTETIRNVEEREREYAACLERLNESLGAFSRTLRTMQEDMNGQSLRFIQALSGQEEPLGRAAGELARFGQAADRIAAVLERSPVGDFDDRIRSLNGDMGELDRVVEAVIGLLENKVERMKV